MHAPIHLKLIIISAILVCVFIHAKGQIQTDANKVDLTELSLEQLHNIKITSASKIRQEAGQAPATVVVITEEQIRIRGYRSLLDVLMDLPDFKIDDKVYSINRNRFTLRGIEGQEKFVIMLDGVRISSPTNEHIPIMENYPVNLAKQIEIIYGPASALYGADALSGIINIISKTTGYASSKIEASYTMGDHSLYNGSVFASKKISKDVLLTVSGQYFYDRGVNMSKQFNRGTLWDMTSHTTGTFKTIFGPMTPKEPVNPEYGTPLMAYNAFVGLKAGKFDFSFYKNYAENSTAIENNPNNAVYNKDVFYGREISVFNTKYTKNVNKVTFATIFTASQYKLNPESNYRNLYTGMERAYKYGYGGFIRGEEQVEWKISEKSNLIGGAIFENFYSIPESADLQNPVKGSRAPEGVLLNTPSYYRPGGLDAKFYPVKYYNTGGYMQLQQKAFREITFTVGARYDYNSRFGSTFNPRVGVVWNSSPKTTLKAIAGTAYLAPTTGSSYSYWGSFYTLDSGRSYQSYFFHLPNPKLKPMISRNAELSISQNIGKNFRATLTGYYTYVTNLLDFASDEAHTNLYGGKFMDWNVDYIEVFINRGHQEIMGASLQLAYNRSIRKGSINAYSYASYVDGSEELYRMEDDGAERHFHVELDNISHWMIKSGVDLSVADFSLSPRLIWLSPQHLAGFTNTDTPEERQTIEGYTLLNLSLSYKLGKIALFTNVTNALNQKYKAVGPNMDLSNSNTELFYGNYQDPIRINGGLRVHL